MKKIFLLLMLIPFLLIAQENFKEKAFKEFKKQHYSEAIAFLEKALNENPNDFEIYYYLGYYNHYRAYDSRPLKGYNFEYSKKVFEYLDKALELNSKYGNAKYFYGVECCANAFVALQNFNAEKYKYFYKLAYKKGAYPKWLLEWGRNILNSCDKDAIFFAGGNADYDICSYLQLHENFRKDITIISIGFIEVPWYMIFLKKGLPDCVKKIECSLTEQQLMSIRPSKWDTTIVKIPFSKEYRKKCELSENYEMQWKIEPDLFNFRPLLSPQRMCLLQIVEDNYSKRPIYLANCGDAFSGGLNKYLRNCGLVSELMPIKTQNSKFENDYEKKENIWSI